MFAKKRTKNKKRYAKKRSGIVLNVKVSKTRKVRKFFSSSFFKKVVVLVSFGAIGVFATIVGAMGLEAFFKDSRYRVEEVVVYNQNLFSKDEILNMSGLTPGMYWFDFSVKKAAAEIERNPNVRRAEVDRVLPHKVILKVIERRPVALLRGDRQDFLIDAEGVVLPMRYEVAGTLPVINGSGVTQEAIGAQIKNQQILNALNFLIASWDTDLDISLEIHHIDISSPNTLIAWTRNGLKVLVGEGDYGRKLSRLSRVTEHLERSGKWADVIDLRFKDVVVRPIEMKSIHTENKLIQGAMPVIRVERR